MSIINTNIASLTGQTNLRNSQSSLSTAMERLSSGLRVNSAKDDAAGQAIANRMTAQINGLAQAQRNANDGISIAQTTEGGLNQINDNLQRIRELTVQAQNGTNFESDLQSIQDEIEQRLTEINRISAETDFNGVRVLSESASSLNIQVGSNDGQSIPIDLRRIDASALNLNAFSITGARPATERNLQDVGLEKLGASGGVAEYAKILGRSATVENVLNNEVLNSGVFISGFPSSESSAITLDGKEYIFNSNINGSEGFQSIERDIGTSAAADRMTPDSGFNEVVVNVDDTEFFDILIDVNGQIFNTSGVPLHYSTNGGVGQFVIADASNPHSSITNVAAGLPSTPPQIRGIEDGGVSYTPDGSIDAITSWSVEAFFNDVVAGNDAVVNLDRSDLGADDYHISADGFVSQNGATIYFNADAPLGSRLTTESGPIADRFFVQENGIVLNAYDEFVYFENGELLTDPANRATANPLEVLDSSLTQVDSLRSELGAVQNRFEDAITNLSTNETNLAAARSRIEDADYAVEVANMTRAQILQQAGTSVLAQANQIPQNVLALLG